MQVTIRRFPCARVRAFVHVERVFEAACGIGDDLVEPVLLAEVCQREAVCPYRGRLRKRKIKHVKPIALAAES